MAHHKSAEKRNRQRATRTAHNDAIESKVRRAVREARAAIAAGAADAPELLRRATSLLDRAASKGMLPVQRTSRLKSRLAQQLHKSQHR